MLWTLNILIAQFCRLRWWKLLNYIFLTADEMMIWSRCRLTEMLSHGNYWFNYLRFCCDSSILADSNQNQNYFPLLQKHTWGGSPMALIFAYGFLRRVKTWSWKFSGRSIVTSRNFSECVFSMLKLVTYFSVHIKDWEKMTFVWICLHCVI